MSIKRSSTAKTGTRSGSDDFTAKIDKQDFWDDLQKRAETKEPFTAHDVAQAIGASEATVSKQLGTLVLERLIDRVEGGMYRADLVEGITQENFVRALNVRADPKRQQVQVEIDRLKKNNDEMRRRLLDAVAERDRCRALLQKHGIDPAEAV